MDVKKIILGIVLITIVFVCISCTDDKVVVKTLSSSSNEHYHIRIDLVGEAVSFGRQKLAVFAFINNNRPQELFKTEISNDGKVLKDDNCSIEWDENKAIITFSGEEQQDERYKVVFSDDGIKHTQLTE